MPLYNENELFSSAHTKNKAKKEVDTPQVVSGQIDVA